MSSAALDRLLAALIASLAATGGVSLLSGAPVDGWLFLVHDVLGALLAVAVVAKLARSVPKAVRARRWGRLVVAAVVTAAAGTSILAAFAWVAGGSIVWLDLGLIRWSLLTVHAVAGIALLPLVLAHLAPRRWRVLRVPRATHRARPVAAATVRPTGPTIPRRTLLTAAGYSAVALVLVGTATTLAALRCGARRFTGSRFLPEGPPGVPTTFPGDAAPAIDLAEWTLKITGRVEPGLAPRLPALPAAHTRA